MEKLFKKYKNNPVLGKSELGTCFDVYVTKDEGRFRMDFSWRKYNSCAVSFSDDGINWSDPFITLAHRPESGWEERVNRNCVLKIDGKYKMWYTGQAREYSFIGYENIDKAQICFARSDNGITGWTKFIDNPVISPSKCEWDADACYKPSFLWNEEKKQWMLWYNGRRGHDEYIGPATAEERKFMK